MTRRPWKADLARSVRLFQAFRREQSDADRYYGILARDTAAQLASYTDPARKIVLDVGGGPGYFARAFEARGATCLCVDADAGELSSAGAPRPGSVLGSALALPVGDGAVDVCFSSNVLEHVPDPWRMGAEMIRVTRPGGMVFLAFTNWLSPWGGHETSPWHYLGGERAVRIYQRKHGKPPKNRFDESLYQISVKDALAWAGSRTDADLIAALPRYLPSWAYAVVRLPGVREFATWNLALVLRRR